MPENQPIPLNPRAAQEILGARAAFVADDNLGEGVRFALGTGESIEVFTRGDAITGARVITPEAGGFVSGAPFSFEHGPDWVGVRGTTDEGITLFAALRKTGDATTRRTGPPEVLRDEQAAKEVLEAQLAGPGAQQPSPPAPSAARGIQATGESGQEREPVEITGRLGGDLRITRRPGQPVRVGMRIAEHVPDDAGGEKTVWHSQMWADAKLASRLAEQDSQGTLPFRKGTEVVAKGFRNTYTSGPREGKPFIVVHTLIQLPKQPGKK